VDEEAGHGGPRAGEAGPDLRERGDRAAGKPLHLALLELLRREHARGATVLRGLEGFGVGGVIHVAHLVDVAPSLPVIVE